VSNDPAVQECDARDDDRSAAAWLINKTKEPNA
jgi:hypothetical protein